MKKFFAAVLFLGVFFSGVNAAVSSLTFTTDPLAVAPNTISEGLTVSTGEAVGEVSDLTLSSSSGTGEFLNSSGAEFKPTWNSNWANRTFYYRDATAGTYTITASLTTRAGQQTWQDTQTIVVGEDVANDTDDEADNSDDDQDSDSSDNQNNSSGNNSGGRNSLSSHSATVDLSDFKNSTTLKVGAGRSRLAALHSPVTFKAAVPDNFKNSKTKFNWSFGDGGSGKGTVIKHAYGAPGNYQVVLNAANGNEEAASRTQVKVFKPDLSLGYGFDGHFMVLTLVNRGAEELNIGGWQLTSGDQTFIFPDDTIIAGKGEVALPSTITGLVPTSAGVAKLLYPNGLSAIGTSATQLSKENLVRELTRLKDALANITI